MMRNFIGNAADTVWQHAAIELIYNPDYTHCGRNGDTREILPCVLRIQDPRQRWILSRTPPYNPAFGLVEFVWIITGNNESNVLNFWNPILPRYSGSGQTYHGAYGYRLKKAFGFDQLKRAYEVLSNAPETRQAILQIWNPEQDMPTQKGQPVAQDIPCNVMSLLKLRDGRLHWSQIMRSNDIMRGLPYNIIQFTMLQEVMAGWLGCELGEYFHLSDSLHLYERDVDAFSVDVVQIDDPARKSLSLSYEASEELFPRIYDDLSKVAEGEMNEADLLEIFGRGSSRYAKCDSFIKDMLSIIGSDAARRLHFEKLANELAESCEDRNLKMAGLAWLSEQEEGQ